MEEFKQYIRRELSIHTYLKPSQLVLKSFYFTETVKPKKVTISLFNYLRSIAEQEYKNFKSSTDEL